MDAHARISACNPLWQSASCRLYGIYLGFALGPAKGEHSWDKASAKYVERVLLWTRQGQGLHIGISAYNTFAITVLSYLAQLEAPPEQVLRAEEWALRKIAPAPGQLITPRDLWYLREGFGQTRSCMSISMMAAAAQLRVARHEQWAQLGLPLAERVSRLNTLFLQPAQVQNRFQWADWYRRSHVLNLHGNQRRLEEMGITSTGIVKDILGSQAVARLDHNDRAKVKKHFQQYTYI